MKVTLIESPFANLGSIARAMRTVTNALEITADPSTVRKARSIVLPGVGSFVVAMDWLRRTGLDIAIQDAASGGAALLGVCVGHQLLFDRSDEAGGAEGLRLLRGSVER